MTVSLIYKIVGADAWSAASAAGRFEGAPVDLKDGYIHFSTAAQVRETAAKHFGGVEGLVLAAFDPAALGDGETRAIRVVLKTQPQPILRQAHAARLNDGNAHATASRVSVVVNRRDRAG